MNLQEILSYRNECIHCDRPLVMRITKYPKLSITQNDGGLKIRSGHKDGVYLNFKFDGTYERNKRDYKIHAGPVHIVKRCNFHPLIGQQATPPGNGNIIKLKSRSIGATTMSSALDNYFSSSINSLKTLTCQYDFSLFGDSQGNYACNMTREYLYWHDEEEFWHVNTHFGADFTQIYHSTFENTLDDVMRGGLKIPAANLKGVKNKDQLIEKLKLYTLFS